MSILNKIGLAIFSVLCVIGVVVAWLAPTVFVVFLVLKLCSVVAFSWFWVCFPLILEVVSWAIWIFLGLMVRVKDDVSPL